MVVAVATGTVLWASSALAAGPVHTILDGRELTFDVAPVIKNGRTLVPVRGLLSAMGAQVTWDAGTQTVGVTLNTINMKLPVGSDTATVNGAPVHLDVPAEIIGNRTLIPLRFVSETLGARVAYDDASATITITTRGGSTASRGERSVTLEVTDGPLNVRSGAGTNYAILAQLDTGAQVQASLLQDGWWRIKLDNGTVGWVSGQFVAVATGAASATPSATTAQIVKIAMGELGAAYVYGGASPSGFDCSGFTSWVFRQAGLRLSRTADEQASLGRPVSRENLQPGDLLFWNTDGSGISHVGIYIGGGKFIHAESESTGVIITPVDKAWWSARYAGARRITP